MSSPPATSAAATSTTSGITTPHTSSPPSSSPAVSTSGQATSSSSSATSVSAQLTSSTNPSGPASGQSSSQSNTSGSTSGQSSSASNASVPAATQPTSSTTNTQTTGQPPSSSVPGNSTPSSQISSSTGTRSSGLNATANSQQSNDHHLSDGAVAGVVIGVGVGLALATFLITFLWMRSRRKSRTSKRSGRGAWGRGSTDPRTVQGGDRDPELKQPVLTEQSIAPRGLGSLESYLPQSADDKAVKNKVATLLEQVQLHVENFYHNSTSSISEASAVELMKFDSPDLPEPLVASMQRSRNQVPLIMHGLTRSIISSIMPDTGTERSLLPPDFVALPNVIVSSNSNKPDKAGFDEAFARWRVLSAYIRPTPTEDTRYILHRDHIISELVRTFSHAFAPWQNPNYRDGDRVRSLTEIMKSAADLGIWLFSQPSTFQFQWRAPEKSGRNTIVVAPALVKVANERAQTLSEAQVMLEMIIRKI